MVATIPGISLEDSIHANTIHQNSQRNFKNSPEELFKDRIINCIDITYIQYLQITREFVFIK